MCSTAKWGQNQALFPWSHDGEESNIGQGVFSTMPGNWLNSDRHTIVAESFQPQN